MSISTGVSPETLVTFLLVLIRVGAWLWLTPPFGGRMMPVLVRIMLSIALALPMTAMAGAATKSVPMTVPGLAGAAIVQVIIGVSLGLVCLTLISAVQAAGAAIDVFGGFSIAQAYDPMLMQQSTVMARVYQLMAGVLLLVSGGYLMLLAGFANSFQALPLDASWSSSLTAATLTSALTKFFIATLQIAGPLIGVMVVADLGLGLVNRVAPSLNAFSLGFPLKIGLTLLLVGFALPLLQPAVTTMTGFAVAAMQQMTGG